jgi:lipid II isoglutaminyl synthase (glutamine-hydrolysing)
MDLRIGWLYGHEMNIYGDRGNVLALARRAEWRGIAAEVVTIGLGEPVSGQDVDLFFWGGGQDREQIAVAADLAGPKGQDLKAAIEDGTPILAICGGYQLLGHYYRPHGEADLPGIGALDVTSEAGSERFIGNIVVESEEYGTLVGFENHSGLTHLSPGVRCLGTVTVGRGNNGVDGQEGARYLNAIGCYMHGSLLPKNPVLADWLIARSLERKYGSTDLEPLHDEVETLAHDRVVRRALQLAR